MFTIYQITNLITGKYYIGKTVQTLEIRWRRHLKDLDLGKMTRLYCAIRKYGIQNFSMDAVAEADTVDELNRQERLWIFLMDSNNPIYGYNMTEGGDGGDTSSGIKRSPETIAKLKANSGRRLNVSTEEIAKLYLSGLGSNAIGKILKVRRNLVLIRLEEAGIPRRSGNGKIVKPKEKRETVERVGENASNYNRNVPTEEVGRLYQEGKTTRQIAAIFGVEKTLVLGRLRALGVSPRLSSREARVERLVAEGKEEFINPDSKEMARLYDAGHTTEEIAAMFELTHIAVRNRLIKEGTTFRPSGKRKKAA